MDSERKLTGFIWKAADHFDQLGFSQSAISAIYDGANYDERAGSLDLLHINSISLLGKNHWFSETGDERFNPDNIIFSSRSANIIAIISRATGEIVWKIGPDFIEGSQEYAIGQIMGPHHAHMIPAGLPGEGNILIFDNGGLSGYGGQRGYPQYSRTYSRVIEIDPISLEIVWEYGAESGEQFFYSHNVSSAQRLPNGNTLVTDGANGRVFEVTVDNRIVWEYTLLVEITGNNTIYRAYRVPPEWVPGNPAGYIQWEETY